MIIELPNEVNKIIKALEDKGHEAYIVGGCVRDLLMGMAPHDWDITTNALPDQIISCFAAEKIVETGLKHGTVTIIVGAIAYEVTTYRIEGKYSDCRHPDSVVFTTSLKDDLSRRDFTINAMAYNPRAGLVDYFHGKDDLLREQIICVGNPDERFHEDALRIIRALRFASVLGFQISASVSKSLLRNKDNLKKIALERINVEFCKLLCGKNVRQVLLNYSDVLEIFIPEIKDISGFAQNNPYHFLDIWQHTVEAVAQAPADKAIRLALLFHDIGKPHCYSLNKQGLEHFYGHAQYGSELACKIMKRLRFDGQTINTVRELILYHDMELLPNGRQIKRLLNKMGEERLRQLLQVMQADIMGKCEIYREASLKRLRLVLQYLDHIIEQQLCFQLKDLAVNGKDLLDIGIPQGRQIGLLLHKLMEMVINEEIENDKKQLLIVAKSID